MRRITYYFVKKTLTIALFISFIPLFFVSFTARQTTDRKSNGVKHTKQKKYR